MTNLNWAGSKVALIGGAGFIGRALAERLSKTGASITIIDNLSAKPLLPVVGDCYEESAEELTPERLSDVDVVIHLAADKSVPRSFIDSQIKQRNIDMTRRVLWASERANVSKLVITSSCEVYGEASRLPNREGDPYRPRSPYAESKTEIERLVSSRAKNSHVDITIARLFNVYGPGERPDAVIPRVCASIVADVPFPIEGEGTQRRDFSYISTTAQHLLNISMRPNLRVVNIGSGVSSSIRDLLACLTSSRVNVDVEHGRPRKNDISEFRADVSMLNAYSSGVSNVPLSVGLTETLNWWKSMGPRFANEALTAEEKKARE
ncbi:NAD-dependent epimerase/dehydratase family protein [Rathayibacter agropyri]|uniref:NAD-dependent epimerase/dehydratase family protein n=1 Tax=Rathayibacter agropyri TaxID=1634927 RepID=UPI001566F043|nr:NAD-dependent epimerase/dehydratase family protein [Rathayibacter agropyri]NRD08529.1 NAD-dependent epimerase/dehydratase family protein [Rathayibacter agropyri]